MRSSGMRARLNDDVRIQKKNERIQKRRIQDFHRLHLRVARSLRSLANNARRRGKKAKSYGDRMGDTFSVKSSIVSQVHLFV